MDSQHPRSRPVGRAGVDGIETPTSVHPLSQTAQPAWDGQGELPMPTWAAVETFATDDISSGLRSNPFPRQDGGSFRHRSLWGVPYLRRGASPSGGPSQAPLHSTIRPAERPKPSVGDVGIGGRPSLK